MKYSYVKVITCGDKIIVKCKDKEVIRTFLSMETYNAESPLLIPLIRCANEDC